MGHYDDQRDAYEEQQAKSRAFNHDRCISRITGTKKTEFYDHIKRLDSVKNKIPLTADDRSLIDRICNLYLGKMR